MSDRRPPEGQRGSGETRSGLGKSSNVSIADHSDDSEPSLAGSVPADAATLGFADLAERAPTGELAEFRDLRARLFGDIDVSQPAFTETEIDDERGNSQPAILPFVPEQVSIANGALTAAEIAAADQVDDEVDLAEEHPAEPRPHAGASVKEDLSEPLPEAEQESDPAPELEPEPEPLPSDSWVFNGATSTTEDVSHRRKGPLIAIAAALVLAALVGGWFAFAGGANSPEATPTPDEGAAVAGQASKVLATSATEIDGESLRTSQTLSFTDTIAQLTLRVPERGPGSPAQDFDLEITDIAISVDGQPTQQILGQLEGESADLTIDLDHPSDDFTISYVASGAVVRTEPSSAHRAKALVTPVLIEAAGDSTGMVIVAGADVLNLGCAAPGQAMEACGQRTPDGWEVEVPALDTEVIAQVDLPQ